MTFVGPFVVVQPAGGLMPGETMTLSIEAGAVAGHTGRPGTGTESFAGAVPQLILLNSDRSSCSVSMQTVAI